LTVLIVRQAGENLELVTERYRLGQANSVEVTDAQADLSRARGEEVGARFDYQSAVAAILHTTGEE
jgi:outer membrane protein TolC